MKLSILFFPNLTKKSLKTGKIPLYVRIILDCKKAEMRLNVELDDSELSKWDEATMRFKDRNMTANALINTIDKNFEDFRHHNAVNLRTYNVKTIRDIIMGVNIKRDQSILAYIDKYYKSAVEPNEQMAEGTKRNYRKAIKHIRDFLAFRKSNDATLKEMNMSFAYEFRDYLLGTHPEIKRIGMKEPSALDNIKRLRTMFDRAVDQELIPINYFKKIKLKNKAAQRARLDIDQVKRIYDLDLSKFPTQQLYKDIFLFSVFTGLAYVDGSTLKQSDLNSMRDGNIRLYLKRNKTNIETEMFLPECAVDIIDRYKNTLEIEITNAVLPKRSNKEVNVQLKILANLANISIKLTTHIARHTFRQLIAEADIFEMGVIKRMMGHSSSNEIDGTYYSVTHSRLLEAKRKFDLYLKKALS